MNYDDVHMDSEDENCVNSEKCLEIIEELKDIHVCIFSVLHRRVVLYINDRKAKV